MECPAGGPGLSRTVPQFRLVSPLLSQAKPAGQDQAEPIELCLASLDPEARRSDGYCWQIFRRAFLPQIEVYCPVRHTSSSPDLKNACPGAEGHRASSSEN